MAGKGLLLQALPGIGVTIVCAIIGISTISTRFTHIAKIENFVDKVNKGEAAQLNPADCGVYRKFARSVLTMNQQLDNKIHWYESILNALPWAVSVTDMDMKWQFCNTESLKSMNKTSNKEIFGIHCSAKKGNICNTPNCGIEQLRHGIKNVVNHMPNGKTMSITLGYLNDKNGKRIGHVEVGMDITDKIELERKSKLAAEESRAATVAKIEGVAKVIDDTATQLNHALESVHNQANEAAARLAEAATAMNEMNSTVLEVANNAEGAADAAASVQTQAQDGTSLVVKTVNSLHILRDLSVSLKTDMSGLDKQARDIGTVLTLIRDIADQTNLLALNAAIEAARAGEAGRGFAVVADEVRKLAEKTMSATRDVESAIDAIQEGTVKSSQTMDNAVEAIESTSQMGEDSGKALEHISSLAADSSMRVSAIATAATEQSAASDEINRSIAEVNHLSADIAQAMDQAVSRTSDMAREARVLTDILDKIRMADNVENIQ